MLTSVTSVTSQSSVPIITETSEGDAEENPEPVMTTSVPPTCEPSLGVMDDTSSSYVMSDILLVLQLI